VLLLDRELTRLPLEGLSVFQSSCTSMSRATSLHTLRESMQLPAATELEQIQLAAAAAAGRVVNVITVI